eukprot:2645407-Lingulodinium_polyedra.AAC.1
MAMGPSPICAIGGAAGTGGGKETTTAPGTQNEAEMAEPVGCAPWPRVVTHANWLTVGQNRRML